MRRTQIVEFNILGHGVLLIESHSIFRRRCWRPVHAGRVAERCARILICLRVARREAVGVIVVHVEPLPALVSETI